MLNEPSFIPGESGWIEVICAESGRIANYSQRVIENKERLLVGESEAYEPRARHCFRPPVDRRRGKPLRTFNNSKEAGNNNETS